MRGDGGGVERERRAKSSAHPQGRLPGGDPSAAEACAHPGLDALQNPSATSPQWERRGARKRRATRRLDYCTIRVLCMMRQ